MLACAIPISIELQFAKHLPSMTFLFRVALGWTSARVARRTWAEFARGGYGLKNVCEFLGYDFAHHDALEDAKAAAQVLLAPWRKRTLMLPGGSIGWSDRYSHPQCHSNPESLGMVSGRISLRRSAGFTGASRFPVVRLRTWLLRSDALLQMALQRKPPSWL